MKNRQIKFLLAAALLLGLATPSLAAPKTGTDNDTGSEGGWAHENQDKGVLVVKGGTVYSGRSLYSKRMGTVSYGDRLVLLEDEARNGFIKVLYAGKVCFVADGTVKKPEVDDDDSEEKIKQPTPDVTRKPTPRLTVSGTRLPVPHQTASLTKVPTHETTEVATEMSVHRTTEAPTKAPTLHSTVAPTKAPTFHPTVAPTKVPSPRPTVAPTKAPTIHPTATPEKVPTPRSTVAAVNVPDRKVTGPQAVARKRKSTKTPVANRKSTSGTKRAYSNSSSGGVSIRFSDASGIGGGVYKRRDLPLFSFIAAGAKGKEIRVKSTAATGQTENLLLGYKPYGAIGFDFRLHHNLRLGFDVSGHGFKRKIANAGEGTRGAWVGDVCKCPTSGTDEFGPFSGDTSFKMETSGVRFYTKFGLPMANNRLEPWIGGGVGVYSWNAEFSDDEDVDLAYGDNSGSTVGFSGMAGLDFHVPAGRVFWTFTPFVEVGHARDTIEIDNAFGTGVTWSEKNPTVAPVRVGLSIGLGF